MQPVDNQPVWSLLCFVVPSPHRGRGVARALLARAVAHVRKRGARILEAYPVDKAERSHDDFIWHGAPSMLAAAGFREAARRTPERPGMRLDLA